MGQRGPAPKPTALRVIEGTEKMPGTVAARPGKEPTPRDALPLPVEDMSEEVLEVWHETVRELSAMGLAAAADRAALAAYCEAVVMHRRASRILAEEPLYIMGPHGPARNPAIAIQKEAAATLKTYAHEFGLTPSARAAIRLPEPKDSGGENPFA